MGQSWLGVHKRMLYLECVLLTLPMFSSSCNCLATSFWYLLATISNNVTSLWDT